MRALTLDDINAKVSIHDVMSNNEHRNDGDNDSDRDNDKDDRNEIDSSDNISRG